MELKFHALSKFFVHERTDVYDFQLFIFSSQVFVNVGVIEDVNL